MSRTGHFTRSIKIWDEPSPPLHNFVVKRVFIHRMNFGNKVWWLSVLFLVLVIMNARASMHDIPYRAIPTRNVFQLRRAEVPQIPVVETPKSLPKVLLTAGRATQ